MAKLDRLGWAAGIAFRAHGLTVGVRLNHAALLDEVRARLPAGARPSRASRVDYLVSAIAPVGEARSGTRRMHLAYVDSTRVVRSTVRSELLDGIARTLEETLIIGAPARLFLHAGVVGWKGRALVLPGASHAGKTTLVTALLRRGATYFSDEYAVLDAAGRVHPFPRRLRVRIDGDVVVEEVEASTLGAATGKQPLPVALVALVPFCDGARFATRALSPGRAALELLGHAPAARIRPRESLALLLPLLRGARVVRGTRGDAELAAERLLQMLEHA